MELVAICGSDIALYKVRGCAKSSSLIACTLCTLRCVTSVLTRVLPPQWDEIATKIAALPFTPGHECVGKV